MKFLITVALVFSLSACNKSTKNYRADFSKYIQSSGLVAEDRVQHFKFLGWQPLSQRYLILRSSSQRSYLVELFSDCIDLPFANQIAVKQTNSRSLSSKFDSITVAGQLRQNCRIDAIYPLDKEQRVNLLDFSNQNEAFRDS